MMIEFTMASTSQDDDHAGEPRQHAKVTADGLAESKTVDEVGREPGQAKGQAPVAGESNATYRHDARAEETTTI